MAGISYSFLQITGLLPVHKKERNFKINAQVYVFQKNCMFKLITFFKCNFKKAYSISIQNPCSDYICKQATWTNAHTAENKITFVLKENMQFDHICKQYKSSIFIIFWPLQFQKKCTTYHFFIKAILREKEREKCGLYRLGIGRKKVYKTN